MGYTDLARRADYLKRYYADPENRARASANARKWYRRNQERARASRRAWRLRNLGRERDAHNKRRALMRAFADAAKGGGCVDCGEKDLRVLELDHVRGVKLLNIGDMAHGHTLSEFLTEIDKCEPRCANCHRRATYLRRAASV